MVICICSFGENLLLVTLADWNVPIGPQAVSKKIPKQNHSNADGQG
jgi:hypothetical protein